MNLFKAGDKIRFLHSCRITDSKGEKFYFGADMMYEIKVTINLSTDFPAYRMETDEVGVESKFFSLYVAHQEIENAIKMNLCEVFTEDIEPTALANSGIKEKEEENINHEYKIGEDCLLVLKSGKTKRVTIRKIIPTKMGDTQMYFVQINTEDSITSGCIYLSVTEDDLIPIQTIKVSRHKLEEALCADYLSDIREILKSILDGNIK